LLIAAFREYRESTFLKIQKGKIPSGRKSPGSKNFDPGNLGRWKRKILLDSAEGKSPEQGGEVNVRAS
jgi:hypothetical protein